MLIYTVKIILVWLYIYVYISIDFENINTNIKINKYQIKYFYKLESQGYKCIFSLKIRVKMVSIN